MKNIVLTPNPYRDKNFQTVRSALQILKNAGAQTRLCLPFEVDRGYELPKDLRFSRLERELPNAETVRFCTWQNPPQNGVYPCWESISGPWALLRNWRARNWINLPIWSGENTPWKAG